MLNTLRFGIIEVPSDSFSFQNLWQLSIVSTGKAGEPHKEVGRPPRGGDRRQPWVQGSALLGTRYKVKLPKKDGEQGGQNWNLLHVVASATSTNSLTRPFN